MTRRLMLLAPAAALVVALSSVDLPLFTLGPGPAREVIPLIDVDGVRVYRPDGRFLLTTVGLDRPTVIEAVAAWADRDVEVVPEDQVIPQDQSEREYERESQALMDASKIAATAVALRRMTDYPVDRGPGFLVQQVLPGSPADGRLRPGEVILSVDGRPLESRDQLEEAVGEAGTREDLRLLVDSAGKRRTVDVRPANVRGQGRPVIGVFVLENFPFDVRIESGDVGGPSAGLMWALGLVELLGPEDLTAGRTVAGTGEIDLDGEVGGVGGVRHKVVAAARAGADLFLVPVDNLAEARAAKADIELVAVGSLEQAIRRLESS